MNFYLLIKNFTLPHHEWGISSLIQLFFLLIVCYLLIHKTIGKFQFLPNLVVPNVCQQAHSRSGFARLDQIIKFNLRVVKTISLALKSFLNSFSFSFYKPSRNLHKYCLFLVTEPKGSSTLSRKYSHLNIGSFVEKVALRLQVGSIP